MRILLVPVLILLLLVLPGCKAEQAAIDTLSIVGGGSIRHDFQVEIANTPDSRAMGLMFRTSLAPDAGMLFTFDDEQLRQFWMKNTLIPLDMIFMGPGGVIRVIHANAVPGDQTPVPAEGVPCIAVLEIKGGQAALLGLKPGDVVHHPFFGNALADSSPIH